MRGFRGMGPYLAIAAVAIGFGNFFWLLAESLALGGDGLAGYVAGGHWFLGSHGTYTEVSQATWEWSRIHASSLFITHPLALVGAGYLVFQRAFASRLKLPNGTGSARLLSLKALGPRLAYRRCAVHLGEVRLNGPFVGVSVFPGGIALKPILMAPRAILAAEIQNVVPQRRFGGGWVEVVHTSPECASPVKIFVSPTGDVASAIKKVFEERASQLTGVPAPAVQSLGAVAQRPTTPAIVRYGTVAIGLAVFAALLYFGMTWVLPQTGAFGILWMVGLVTIAILNLRKYLRRPRVER